MVTRKKSSAARKKRSTTRRKKYALNWARLIVFLFLLSILTLSIATAGYVIFFRTVFASELVSDQKNPIVYEEPDPPAHVEHDAGEMSQGNITLPKVAIIIDDMGYDERIGHEMLELPLEMTYSFLPFAPFTGKLETEAFFSGKTIFLHLPLQPQSLLVDPGPGTIYVTDTAREQVEKLRACLREVPHAVGVNNHMGSKFTQVESGMRNLMGELAEKKMLFVDSVTSSESVAYVVAQEYGVKSARRQVFLDNDQEVAKICGQLAQLVLIAE